MIVEHISPAQIVQTKKKCILYKTKYSLSFTPLQFVTRKLVIQCITALVQTAASRPKLQVDLSH